MLLGMEVNVFEPGGLPVNYREQVLKEALSV